MHQLDSELAGLRDALARGDRAADRRRHEMEALEGRYTAVVAQTGEVHQQLASLRTALDRKVRGLEAELSRAQHDEEQRIASGLGSVKDAHGLMLEVTAKHDADIHGLMTTVVESTRKLSVISSPMGSPVRRSANVHGIGGGSESSYSGGKGRQQQMYAHVRGHSSSSAIGLGEYGVRSSNGNRNGLDYLDNSRESFGSSVVGRRKSSPSKSRHSTPSRNPGNGAAGSNTMISLGGVVGVGIGGDGAGGGGFFEDASFTSSLNQLHPPEAPAFG